MYVSFGDRFSVRAQQCPRSTVLYFNGANTILQYFQTVPVAISVLQLLFKSIKTLYWYATMPVQAYLISILYNMLTGIPLQDPSHAEVMALFRVSVPNHGEMRQHLEHGGLCYPEFEPTCRVLSCLEARVVYWSTGGRICLLFAGAFCRVWSKMALHGQPWFSGMIYSCS